MGTLAARLTKDKAIQRKSMRHEEEVEKRHVLGRERDGEWDREGGRPRPSSPPNDSSLPPKVAESPDVPHVSQTYPRYGQ